MSAGPAQHQTPWKKSLVTYSVFLLLIVFARDPGTVAGAGFGYRARQETALGAKAAGKTAQGSRGGTLLSPVFTILPDCCK